MSDLKSSIERFNSYNQTYDGKGQTRTELDEALSEVLANRD